MVKHRRAHSHNHTKTHKVMIIIIIILAILLAGLAGYLVWRNFFNTPAATTSSVKNFEDCKKATGSIIQETYPETCVTADGQSFTGPTTQVTLATTTLEYNGTTIELKYPQTWTKSTDGDFSVLTSPDGNVSVRYTLTPPSGIGGTCGNEEDTVQQPLFAMGWGEMPNLPNVLFATQITSWLKSEYTPEPYYSYQAGAFTESDDIKNAKVGDSACLAFAFKNFINLEQASGATLQASVRFKDIDQKVEDKSATTTEIDAAFEGKGGKEAQAIIESIVLK